MAGGYMLTCYNAYLNLQVLHPSQQVLTYTYTYALTISSMPLQVLAPNLTFQVITYYTNTYTLKVSSRLQAFTAYLRWKVLT